MNSTNGPKVARTNGLMPMLRPSIAPVTDARMKATPARINVMAKVLS